MDKKSAGFSDKQTNMTHRSKVAFYESIAKSTEPARKKTENPRRKYQQAQAASAIERDEESPLQSPSPGRSFDLNYGSEFDNELREKMAQVSVSQSRRLSPHDLEIFQHPMCMISAVSEKNKIGEETKIHLKSEEEVFDQIAKIDWPIVVVAVAGLYRTGKSYLMNRLAESSEGFELGDTIESKTKGIWAWCKMHPTQSNTVLLLLDTEGLGDVEKGDPRYDNKIFTLATLLCNCLVYNMKGAFDNDAVSKLTFVTEMASNIRFRGKSLEDNQLINLILPDFVLCLRDFSLKLIKDGKRITENDYLELSLAENKGKTDQFNKPRACIRKYFTKRECFAFPVPGDGDVLENLETLSFTQLSKRFKEVTSRFKSYIYKIPPKNLLASKPINGQMFVTLADHYVTAIKNGAVPDVDDAFTAVAKIENAKVEKEALDIFKNEMETVKLPVPESDLSNRYTNAQNKALHHLRQNVVQYFQAECEIEAQAEQAISLGSQSSRRGSSSSAPATRKETLSTRSPRFLDVPFTNIGVAELLTIGKCQLSGYLNIQSKDRFGKNWKRRFVIISRGCLYIFANENATKMKDSYSLDDFESVSEDKIDYCFFLKFKEAGRSAMVCSCESAMDRTEWIFQIQKTMSDIRTYFQGDSGFESAEMTSVPCITVSTETLVDYSSVDESRLYKIEPNRTEKPTVLRAISSPSLIKEGIPRQGISYPSTLSLPTPTEESIPRREMSYPCTLSLPTPMKETWQNCFRNSKNFEKHAKMLLLKGLLPDDTLLQSICKRYGRKSEIIRYITNAICQNIKEQSNNIVQVWPAFRYGNDLKNSENHIIFVIIMETHTDIKTRYQIYERNINKILPVSEKENYCIRDNEKLSDVKINDITLCLKSNASKLMETHKNLTCVTISRVKSSGYGRENRIVKSLCIVLYVQVKGFIPIDEDPFEQFIDGYPVDVREGVFTLCGSPTDLHHNVRMGCALDSGFGTNQGTIGPFFRYQTDPYTYLLTSAHVLLDPEQMKKLIVDNEVHYGMFGTDTYQPPESISVEHNSRHHLGKLEFAVYRKGGQYKPGMEVALVRINKNRIPIDGKFPSKSGANDVVGEFYAGGNFSYSKLLNDPYVYKFGSVTGLTKGRVRLQGASVRTSTLHDNSLGLDITLHDQIEIEPVDGVAFGELGDSGSLVFQKDGNRLAAFGIFEGKVNDDTYMVTPILEIKQALSELMSRYRDPPTDATMDVDEHNSGVTFMLYYVPPSSNVSLSAGIDRHISDEISRQTTKIQTDILHYTDRKIDSVKTELTTVKAHIDNTKREIIENISSQINAMTQAFMSNKLQMK